METELIELKDKIKFQKELIDKLKLIFSDSLVKEENILSKYEEDYKLKDVAMINCVMNIHHEVKKENYIAEKKFSEYYYKEENYNEFKEKIFDFVMNNFKQDYNAIRIDSSSFLEDHIETKVILY